MTCFSPLPNNKTLDMTKLKAFADDKSNFAKKTISLCDRVENTLGKEENAGYQHFLLFPQCFPKPSSIGLLKVRIMCYIKDHTDSLSPPFTEHGSCFAAVFCQVFGHLYNKHKRVCQNNWD